MLISFESGQFSMMLDKPHLPPFLHLQLRRHIEVSRRVPATGAGILLSLLPLAAGASLSFLSLAKFRASMVAASSWRRSSWSFSAIAATLELRLPSWVGGDNLAKKTPFATGE